MRNLAPRIFAPTLNEPAKSYAARRREKRGLDLLADADNTRIAPPEASALRTRPPGCKHDKHNQLITRPHRCASIHAVNIAGKYRANQFYNSVVYSQCNLLENYDE